MHLVRIGARAGLVLLVVLNFLFAELAMRSASMSVPGRGFEEIALPPASTMRVAFLNFNTFAADLGWIQLIVNYGEGRVQGRPFDNLHPNSNTVRELDPAFYRIYEWFPAVFLNREFPVTFARAETTEQFVVSGLEHFPEDHKLPFHIAMSYVGIQNPPDGPRRRYEKIVKYASLADRRGDPDAAGVLPFYERKLNTEANSAAEEAQLLLTLYSRVRSPADRRRIAERLRELSADPTVSGLQFEQLQRFESTRARWGAYMGQELFALVRR
jgi:hypothetical protein